MTEMTELTDVTNAAGVTDADVTDATVVTDVTAVREHGEPSAPVPSVAHGGPVPAAPAPGDTVLAWYEHWVARTPDATAVVDGERIWTYGELDAAADAVADALRERVRPGDIVGVCLDRSAALVALAIAVARLGAVYLPLGPRPGERRLAAVTENLRVACLIGEPDLLPETHRSAERLALPLPVEGANAPANAVAAFGPSPEGARGAEPGTLYTVLTSGSTGTPKAVAVSDRSLGALLRWHRERVGLGPGDRHSLLIGVAFDPHLLELWAPLVCGAALCVAPDAVRWDPAALTDWLRDAAVTVCVSATPLSEPLLDRPWPRDLALRHLYIGGDRLRRRPGPDVTATVHNVYGPAEATVITTTYAMRPGTTPAGAETDAPPIGRPLAGSVVCVTGADGEVVPRGESGELWIGGDCLALGYLDEELTARRFVPPPGDVTGTARMYRTGDRVRMLANGELEFLGRLDDQVKVSGVRIEPAEVEAAFEHDARVRRAVVAARRSADGTTRLVAFVLPSPGARPTAAELLPGARAWLPEQAVPATVRLVDGFPLDANGKVDRAALLAAEEEAEKAGTGARDATGATDAAAAPVAGEDEAAGPVERMVLGLCRELLERPELTLSDNFLAAGGNSLAVARLLTAVEKEYGVRLRAPQALRQPDLRGLAALIEKRVAAGAASAGSGA
ncbi:non-ribosomal peptide synthetase [Streptomyces sp. URMC 123]|uniref:non-ribosomal peptide synthetase n=1 Tax=Streptomyces sp. URMC 123 TaxID=3423403 RepID=UPI003F1BC937